MRGKGEEEKKQEIGDKEADEKREKAKIIGHCRAKIAKKNEERREECFSRLKIFEKLRNSSFPVSCVKCSRFIVHFTGE